MDHTDGMNDNDGFFFMQLSEDFNPEGVDYYEEYSKLYVSNLLMRKKIEELREERSKLKDTLEKQSSSKQKEKRSRRMAKDITRHYQCDNCGKTYGSEASLKYHMKVKHD